MLTGISLKNWPISPVPLKTSRNTQLSAWFCNCRLYLNVIGYFLLQPPVPADPWTGVRNASVVAKMCPQYPEHTQVYTGTEDCLYVDVYTPSVSKPLFNRPPNIVGQLTTFQTLDIRGGSVSENDLRENYFKSLLSFFSPTIFWHRLLTKVQISKYVCAGT